MSALLIECGRVRAEEQGACCACDGRVRVNSTGSTTKRYIVQINERTTHDDEEKEGAKWDPAIPRKQPESCVHCALSAASTSQVMEHVIVETDRRERERTDGGRTTDARRVIDVISFPGGGGRAEWIGEHQ